MRLDAVFRIASMTKAVTAAAAMQLVEKGRITLDQPMSWIAPELGEARVLLGFDPDGTPRTRAPRREITLRHLLTHTSGYAYDHFKKDVGRYMEHEGPPSITTRRYGSLRAPLLFDPGERWEYGIGLDWAGRIVEIATGVSLEAYLQANIFGPLAMRDTSFVLGDDQEARLVSLAARTPDGSLSAVRSTPRVEADFHSGGGGLYSSGPDYLRFTRNGIRLLLEGLPFRIDLLAPMGGFFWVCARRCVNLLSFLQGGWRWLLFIPLAPFFGLMFPLLLFHLDRLDRKKEFSLGYRIRATRV